VFFLVLGNPEVEFLFCLWIEMAYDMINVVE
jgi:hypothetical protein